MMPGVGLNGLQARTDYAHDLVVAATNKVRQRGSHASLIISDQDPHISICRSFHANGAEEITSQRSQVRAGHRSQVSGQKSEVRSQKSEGRDQPPSREATASQG